MNQNAHASEARQTLAEIRTLSESMIETPEEERILVYRQLNRCFLALETTLGPEPDPRIVALLDKLKVHLIALARLDDPDQLSDAQHLSGALQAIEALRRAMRV